jgi:hypothetical protein
MTAVSILLGIFCGLWAAFFQALSYVATRYFVVPRQGGTRRLLVLAHVWMGGVCLILLPLCWPAQPMPWAVTAGPLVQMTVFYLLGQLGLMVALRHAEPSQVSPMLAFKLIVLAVLSLLVAHERLSLGQWLAIAMCIAGTLLVNYSGRPPLRALAAVAFTCLCYAFSDWNITRTIRVIMRAEPAIHLWRAAMLSGLLSYALAGWVGLALLPWFGSRRRKDWIDAGPFAACWFLGMVGLYPCFALLGVLYGNLLQATRAIISVGLAAAFARLQWMHFERAHGRAVLLRRLSAALLVTAAVMLYQWCKVPR